MRLPKLSATMLAVALIGAGSTVALADPIVVSSVTPTAAPSTVPTPVAPTDADRYAAREARDPSAAHFRGGAEVVVFGATTLSIVLLVVVLVILL